MFYLHKFLLITILVVGFISTTYSQVVTTLDFVKIKNENIKEALFYYENNWKRHRVEAVKRGVIKSFELIKVKNEENSQFDIILITRYPNQKKYEAREVSFKKVMKKTQKDGLKLLNKKQPKDFREVVFSKIGEGIFFQ